MRVCGHYTNGCVCVCVRIWSGQLQKVAGSLLIPDDEEEVDATKAALEQAALLRDDPLMSIEKREHEKLKDIVDNPHKMKKIRQRVRSVFCVYTYTYTDTHIHTAHTHNDRKQIY